ncbi:MAG: 6-phosphogluconolactonase [Cyanophyceae cyanobacterium]
MKKFLEVLPDKETLIQRSLEVVVQKIRLAIEERSVCTLSLAGGSTPKPLYEALAEQTLPWEKLQVFWGDERYVPVSSPQSNQRMVRQAWLDRVSIPEANVHPMPTGAGDPSEDAATYEAKLRQVFGTTAIPTFDIVLLGVGDDGHTASLFPHTDALKVRDRLVTVGKKDGEPRLSFTVPLINSARCVIFLAAGENKQQALAQIHGAAADAMTYPARLIQPQGELWWLLDRGAGAEFIQKAGAAYV